MLPCQLNGGWVTTQLPSMTYWLPKFWQLGKTLAKAPVDVPLELQSLVRQLHGAHIVIDADYTIVAANDAYRESFQQAGDVVGRKCYELSHGYATAIIHEMDKVKAARRVQ